jgi:tetratricopeptide (TPR) repeat protein
LDFTFDENLREVPADSESMAAYVEYLRAMPAGNSEEKIMILGELGVYSRILGKLDEAELHLGEAILLAQNFPPESRFVIATKIRLAHVWQWQKRFKQSDELFDKIIETCKKVPEIPMLLDFAYQHAGKNYFDQGLWPKALEYFQKALLLRQNRCAPDDQITSAQLSIAETKKRASMSI